MVSVYVKLIELFISCLGLPYFMMKPYLCKTIKCIINYQEQTVFPQYIGREFDYPKKGC